MFFLFGVKVGLLFLITKKEKSPLKTSLFSEQQKRYEADLSANKALNLAKVYKSFEPKLHFNAGYAGRTAPNLAKVYKVLPPKRP